MKTTPKIIQASVDYATGKSSSEVFQKAHMNDFLAGAKWYEENSKAPELLESVSELIRELKFHGYNHSTIINNARGLIKEATEL